MAATKAVGLFAVGSTVAIGDDTYTVVKYHRINGKPEVMFRDARGAHKSLGIHALEGYVRLAEQQKHKERRNRRKEKPSG
jgi:hypothetical protein